MQTVTEILIDFSSSMREKLDLTKLTLLLDIIPSLDYSSKIGIKTFAATKEHVPLITSVLALSITNKEQLMAAIKGLGNPNGNTPIAAVIKHAVSKAYLAFDKKIVLITHGEENCGGDYEKEVSIAISDGINCNIHIIGIGLNEHAARQAEKIRALSKGSFSSIPFVPGQTVYQQNVVRQHLDSFYTSIRPAISQPAPTTIKRTVPHNLVVPLPAPEAAAIGRIDTAISEEPTPHRVDGSTLIIDKIRATTKELKDLPPEKLPVLEVIENEEVNERIRVASEACLFEILKRKYTDRVKWLNDKSESHSDHDFEIIDFDGSIEYYIECKGTAKVKPTFYLSKEEWRLFLNHTKNYQIYFIQDCFDKPTAIFIDNLLDWMLKGRIVPYLREAAVIKEERIFLTHIDV